MDYTTANEDELSGKMESSSVYEDVTTKAIEKQTKKIPSDAFLATAFGALALSLSLKLTGRAKDAMFVGQWVAPILIMGVYNKLVKQESSK
jgi:hypothetical protein